MKVLAFIGIVIFLLMFASAFIDVKKLNAREQEEENNGI